MKRPFIVLVALCCLALTNFSWIYGSPYPGVQYYISTSGNDSHDGLSPATAWLTPNHAVKCGDILNQAAGSYTASNFQAGKWGAVSSCPSSLGIYFAQLKCVGPLVTSCSYADYVGVDKSNWAIVGGSATSSNGGCWNAYPATATNNVHHIAFINVVANGCLSNGVNSFTNIGGQPQYGVDYFAVVGAVVYNAAQGSSGCFSGVSWYEPANYDTQSGTHYFGAGIFSYANIDPTNCGAGANSDGEGLIFDDWSHSQQSGSAYTGQGVVEQSIFVGNGGPGVAIYNNTAGKVYVTSSTSYGNLQNPTRTGTYNGEVGITGSTGISSITASLAQASIASVAGGAVYACFVGLGNGNDVVNGNYCYGVSGHNTASDSSPGFSFGTNTTATPNFVNPTTPGAPDCTGAAIVTACPTVTAMVANFVAQAAGAAGLGYQPPGACTPDAYFPVWLKGIVPNGIITKPCGM